jgi:hypothetical protein
MRACQVIDQKKRSRSTHTEGETSPHVYGVPGGQHFGYFSEARGKRLGGDKKGLARWTLDDASQEGGPQRMHRPARL